MTLTKEQKLQIIILILCATVIILVIHINETNNQEKEKEPHFDQQNKEGMFLRYAQTEHLKISDIRKQEVKKMEDATYQIIKENIRLFDGSFDGSFDAVASSSYGYFAFVLDENAEKILWMSDDYGIEKNEKVSRHFHPYVTPWGWTENNSNSISHIYFENENSSPMGVYVVKHEGYLFGAATINALR